jgi:hypothetical protein
MKQGSIREARLRPEAADRFPGAPVGVWLPAGRLSAECLSHHLGQQRLPDDAFEFRGGALEFVIRPRARTRWADHPGPADTPSRSPRSFASHI